LGVDDQNSVLFMKKREMPVELMAQVAISFMQVPGGSFWLGTQRERDPQANMSRELPFQEVHLDGFWICKHPITNAVYSVFMQETQHARPGHWQDGRPPKGQQDHPVVNVSWSDASLFCKWLRWKTGLPVRLPTEQEWEKAARGTDGRLWPTGNERPGQGIFHYDGTETVPVAQKGQAAQSPFGCTDMAGNVAEWTSSQYIPGKLDPGGVNSSTGIQVLRVVKGGSWFSPDVAELRCAARSSQSEQTRRDFIGFRCVMTEITFGE
jgi:formylglycine-generating enzyme required for sulfatase activity